MPVNKDRFITSNMEKSIKEKKLPGTSGWRGSKRHVDGLFEATAVCSGSLKGQKQSAVIVLNLIYWSIIDSCGIPRMFCLKEIV